MKHIFFKPLENWTLIKDNWIVMYIPKIVLIFSILSLIAIGVEWSKLPTLIPVWFSRPWGTDQLANPFYLFIFPATSMGILAINTMFSMFITADYLIFTQALYLTSLLISIMSFTAVIKILFLVI